jgi:hypothetical protein
MRMGMFLAMTVAVSVAAAVVVEMNMRMGFVLDRATNPPHQIDQPE